MSSNTTPHEQRHVNNRPESRRPSADKLDALRLALSGAYLRRALTVTLLVGILLNLINQGDALIGDAKLNVAKLALTFLVPFCVSTFASWSAIMEQNATKDGE